MDSEKIGQNYLAPTIQEHSDEESRQLSLEEELLSMQRVE